METLSSADCQRLNDFFGLLNVPCNIEDFPGRLMAALLGIVPAESCGLVSFSLPGKRPPEVVTFPDPLLGLNAMAFFAQPKGFGSHPLLAHYSKTLDGQAAAISDLLDEADLYRQTTLYKGFLQPHGIEDQLWVFFEQSPPWLLPTAARKRSSHGHLGVVLSRDRRSFTDRDRLVLNLIRPHIKQAYDTALAVSQFNAQLADGQTDSGKTAVIVLSAFGAVRWMAQRAEDILGGYFPSTRKTPMALPDLIQRWVARQMGLVTQGEEARQSVKPLRLQMEGRQLTVRLQYCPEVESLYLLLDEADSCQISVTSLQGLGLTQREAEVLFWVAKDKSLVEVATLLGISQGTAKKHLEHIYEKFGVQTRLSAVLYALEQLGDMVC
jgi:DNA-binding CsgD family transcriptional regulator